MKLNIDFAVIDPGCGCTPFAVPEKVQRRWLDDHNIWWYCPSCGSHRHYVGETEKDRLERERNQAIQEASNAKGAQQQAERKYRRIRERVKNGVCPCCNRTFQNLMRHMQTEHPDFGKDKSLRAIRQAYGLTQTALAEEIGITAMHVSGYERGRHIAEYAANALDWWLERQAS